MGLLDSLFGSRPDVPGPINYQGALSGVISGNLANIPSLTDLATQSTDLYTNLVNRSSEGLYPGTAALKRSSLEQINTFLRGEIPEDVSNQLQRIGAERGATSGTAGSPFNRALTARDLGLTSLSLIQGGLSAAERWIARAQAGPIFDFSRMFYTPQDAQRQAENEWQRQWLANQVAASPDPGARGVFDTAMQVTGMVLSAYGGGAGYTGTYQSPYQGQSMAAMSGGRAGAQAGSYYGGYGEFGGSGASGLQSLEGAGGGSFGGFSAPVL